MDPHEAAAKVMEQMTRDGLSVEWIEAYAQALHAIAHYVDAASRGDDGRDRDRLARLFPPPQRN